TSNTNPTGTNAWRPAAQAPAAQAPAALPQPKVDDVKGQITRTDRTPTANTQVLFVNAATGVRHSATTNTAGRFNVALASGNYHVFMTTSSGAAAYHSLVNVDPSRDVNLVNQ